MANKIEANCRHAELVPVELLPIVRSTPLPGQVGSGAAAAVDGTVAVPGGIVVVAAGGTVAGGPVVVGSVAVGSVAVGSAAVAAAAAVVIAGELFFCFFFFLVLPA